MDSGRIEGTDGGRMRIGRYRVESVLGTGAFATVYRAVDERLDDTVAIKVLAENHSLDADLRERFITEGRVLRRVESPHVLQVYDLGETDRNQPYLVLEHAPRGTMETRVAAMRAQGWRPSALDLVRVGDVLGSALHAVHRARVVHRDVNPSNVLITVRADLDTDGPSLLHPDERLLLADLGLCKDLALNSGHTSAGGTYGYRPPELRGGPALIDPRADLWSVSAVLVWLATGRPPVDDTGPDALARAGVPLELVVPLARGLAADPGVRQPDAAAWLSDVRGALTPPVRPTPPDPVTTGGSDAGAHPPRDVMTRWRWVRTNLWLLSVVPFGLTTWAGFLYVGLRARRRRWLWAALGYAVVAVATVVTYSLVPQDAAGEMDMTSGWADVWTAGVLIAWLVAIVHAAFTVRPWTDVVRSRAT